VEQREKRGVIRPIAKVTYEVRRMNSQPETSDPDRISAWIVETFWRDLNELPVDFTWFASLFGIMKTKANFSRSDTKAANIKELLG
jgi:hypothetical protein